jgi:hypothetical protein
MIPVHMEQPGTRWTPDRQRRYWRQSNEAEAAGHPYISIRPRGRSAKIVCDWITSHRRPPALFARMTADHLAACWPEARVKCLGSYTVIARVPIAQADGIAEDIGALARLAMRLLPSTVGHC